MIKRIANFIVKRRYLTAILVLLPVFSLMGGLKYFKTNYNMRYWLDKEDVLIKKLNYFEDNFGNDESAVIAVHVKNGVINEQTLRKIKELAEKIEQIEDVKSTMSLHNLVIPKYSETEKLIPVKIVDYTSFNRESVKENIYSNNYVPGLFINKDETIATIFATLKPTIINDGEVFQEIHYRKLTSSMRKIIKEYNTDDFQLYLSGTPILQNDFTEVSEQDLALIMPVLFTFMAIVMYLQFHSFFGMVAAFIVISLTNTFVYSLAGHLGFEFENMLSIVPLIILTICLADILHIYNIYQKKRLAGTQKISALIESISENFVPTLLTTLTTSIGFLSLDASKLIPVQNMGVLAAAGMFMAWLLSLTLFPIALYYINDKEFKVFSFIQKLRFSRLVNFVIKYPKRLIGVFICLSIVFAYFGIQNEVNTDPVKFFKSDTDIRKSSDFILNEFGAVTGPEIIIHSGYREGVLEKDFLEKVDKYSTWLNEREYISNTISLVTLGKELYRTLHNGDERYYRLPDTKSEIVDLYFEHKDKFKNMLNLSSRMSRDMESMRLTVLWDLTDIKERRERLRSILDKAKEFDLSVAVTGKNALYLELNDYVVDTFFYSIGVSILAISLLMIYLFKSVKIGLISMLPNLIPLCFITGIMYFSNISIDMGTALVCSVCLGIAIDDTIHFLIQYHRQRRDHNVKVSLQNVLEKTGSALFMTSFILVIGFGFFMLSEFIPNIKFGFLCALTITFALITDFFLLPAILYILDEKGSDDTDVEA